MNITDVLRVVALRKGKLKSAEFRLRPDERGLSLFALMERPSMEEIVHAVRLAGKQGDLAAAEFAVHDLRELGLRLVLTPGATTVPEVNAVHCEARLLLWREWMLRIARRSVADYFNEQFSERLCRLARTV